MALSGKIKNTGVQIIEAASQPSGKQPDVKTGGDLRSKPSKG